MYSLIIVEDEMRVRNGLKKYIDWPKLGFELIGEYADGEAAISFLQTAKVDVVLTDIEMAKVTGIELAKYIAKHKPETKVVLLSGHREFKYARQAIEYKVEHYLLKPTNLQETRLVFQNIRALLDRGRHLQEPRHATAQPDSEAAQEEGGSRENRLIRQAQAYMRNHYQQNIALEDVANVVYVSPVYFSRLFKQQTGENFTTYLAKLRLEKAVELLQTREYKIYEISEKVGYRSPKYFNQQFKEILGCTPMEYGRKMSVKRSAADD